MILLDTHIWFWWVSTPTFLSKNQKDFLNSTDEEIAVSIISLWEIAMLDAKKKVELPYPVAEWFRMALTGPKITVLDLDAEIVIDANNLPGEFHRDPADRMIVATSRILQVPLITSDEKILKYPHVPLKKFE